MIPVGTVPFGIVFENGTKRNRPHWYWTLQRFGGECRAGLPLRRYLTLEV